MTKSETFEKLENARDKAAELYDAACSLMRYRHVKNDNQWHNLQNAAMRYNAAQQPTLTVNRFQI